jgi:hypothetical protein
MCYGVVWSADCVTEGNRPQDKLRRLCLNVVTRSKINIEIKLKYSSLNAIMLQIYTRE